MTVVDINGVFEAKNLDDLEAVLHRRCTNSANAFWLSHRKGQYPMLSLLVREDMATLSYISEADHAGFRSVGNIPNLKPGDTTAFSISNDPADDLHVLKDAVLPFNAALGAVKEIFLSGDRPKSIEWLEL